MNAMESVDELSGATSLSERGWGVKKKKKGQKSVGVIKKHIRKERVLQCIDKLLQG